MSLTLTGDQHAQLYRFLFPGDGKEAVAVLLCGRRAGTWRHRLLVREILEIPYEACAIRTPTRVTWPPELMQPLLDCAAAEELSIVKVHSHPNGYAGFSTLDTAGDRALLPMIRDWAEADVPHGSVVMLPDGQMFGRVLVPGGRLRPIASINVVGDDLAFWYASARSSEVPSFAASHAQAFDEGTIEHLRRLWVAVVGCSGTGGPVIEQLMRLGVGVLVIVDGDKMEIRNINRIPNSTMRDVRAERLKVDVQAAAIRRAGLGTRVIPRGKSLWDPEVIRVVAQCDIVVGCMDTIDGRYLLNRLASHYLLPYFDIGVRLETAGEGKAKAIREICGTVHYLQPGRSSLLSRRLFSMEDVAAAGLRRTDSAAHAQQLQDGYIKGVVARRPAVVSVNTFAAGLAVNEMLARIHPFREEPNSAYASVTFSLASVELINESDEGICPILSRHVGWGDRTPLLGLPELAERRAA